MVSSIDAADNDPSLRGRVFRSAPIVAPSESRSISGIKDAVPGYF